jgi:hypothetical protein
VQRLTSLFGRNTWLTVPSAAQTFTIEPMICVGHQKEVSHVLRPKRLVKLEGSPDRDAWFLMHGCPRSAAYDLRWSPEGGALAR